MIAVTDERQLSPAKRLHMADDKLKQFYIDMQKELSRFSDNKNQYPDATLYHYTDMQGLIGILSSRRLWMNHYEKLNDTNEIKHARGWMNVSVDCISLVLMMK